MTKPEPMKKIRKAIRRFSDWTGRSLWVLALGFLISIVLYLVLANYQIAQIESQDDRHTATAGIFTAFATGLTVGFAVFIAEVTARKQEHIKELEGKEQDHRRQYELTSMEFKFRQQQTEALVLIVQQLQVITTILNNKDQGECPDIEV